MKNNDTKCVPISPNEYIRLTEEEIIVLDFKTDYISQTNLQDKIFQYSAQVQTYAKALSRIYKKPVSAAYIYFFSSEQLVCIN